MVATARRISTTDMQVTSIRLETELKERLRELSGNQGYQSLIREILWNYIEQQQREQQGYGLSPADVRSTIAAVANQAEQCALSGAAIAPQSPMLLGLTQSGQWVPISLESWSPGASA
ncbi:MAG: hypothetical protein HC824_16520 [Synechococcales cyanobacterium RM1_1_8]|nr:hypothetical protein [Synechococcales cyanobacterium RM1_1_8]